MWFVAEKRASKDIFVNEEQAHSFLRKRRSFNTGIVCECCIHVCRYSEVEQYCATKRRKRSTKRVLDSKLSANLTESSKEKNLEELYESIDLAAQDPDSIPPITEQDYHKMEILETIKRRNIEKKFMALLMVDTTKVGSDTASIIHADSSSNSTPALPSLRQLIANSVQSKPNRHRHHSQ